MASKKDRKTTQERDIASCQSHMRQHCLGSRVRRLGRIINRVYDDAMRPYGLKGSQLTLLGIISRRGPIQAGHLGRILHLEQSTLSRNLNRMVARGLLEMVPQDDSRVQALRATSKGRQTYLDAFPAWEDAQRKTSELLGDEGVTHLRQLTDILLSRIEKR